jgi:hypothetical protein
MVGIQPIVAQSEIDIDAEVIDTINDGDKATELFKDHNPRKAWQYSAIIPGLGQAYNKKYWKIPIVYAAFGAAYYYYYESALNYHALHDAYIEGQNFNMQYVNQLSDHTKQQLIDRKYFSESYINSAAGRFEISRLQDNINTQQQHMERGIILIFAVYFANVLDALVDGYFFSYDVDSNLAFDVKPGLWYNPAMNGSTPTLSFKFTF